MSKYPELGDYKTWEQIVSVEELEDDKDAGTPPPLCNDNCNDTEVVKKLNIIIELLTDMRQLLALAELTKDKDAQELLKPKVSNIYK